MSPRQHGSKTKPGLLILGAATAVSILAATVVYTWHLWNRSTFSSSRITPEADSTEPLLCQEAEDAGDLDTIPTTVGARVLGIVASRQPADDSSAGESSSIGDGCCGGIGERCGCGIESNVADVVPSQQVEVPSGAAGSCVSRDVEDVEPPYPQLNGDLYARVAPLMSADEERIGEYQSPENVKVYVKTFGCSHNMSDSEVMAGLLKQAGFQLVDTLEESSIAVLNSCTVKNPSQDGAVNLAVKCREQGIKVVMAGCVVQADQAIPQLENVSVIGVKQIQRVVEAVVETLQGNVYRCLTFRGDLPALDLPKVRRNDLIEIIPLSTGCLGACTYCKTRQARGVLGSYSTEAILNRVRQAAHEGVQQIWLTSEDTGAYGIDLGTNIAELLENIAKVLAEEKTKGTKHIMCRLGMTNPPYMLAHLDRLARVLLSPHFFEFMHIPVQSGSDKVLLEMNREYTVGEFQKCASGLLHQIPDALLATDFICGFPGETEENHRQSEALLLHYKFGSLNISQFYPRPGTPAATRKRVPTNIVKQRSQSMTKCFLSYETFEKFVGRTVEVWFSGISDKSDHIVGHTKQYVKVLVPRNDSLIGTSRMVTFNGCSKWHLVGEVVPEEAN